MEGRWSDNDLNKEIETERVEFLFKIRKDTWTGEINMHLLTTPYCFSEVKHSSETLLAQAHPHVFFTFPSRAVLGSIVYEPPKNYFWNKKNALELSSR